MEKWNDRLIRALAETRVTRAELARRIDEQPTLIRSYTSGRTANPRGDIVRRIADALGVEYLWLRDGVAPMRAGGMADDDPQSLGDTLIHRREMAERIAGCRKRRGIASPEQAALGTIISGRRWRDIETGRVAPSPLELRVISERVHDSLDWIVSGSVTPIDSSNPVATEQARRWLNEPEPPHPTRRRPRP
jgi:transcriptional regulator with XRE-family HTH domain